MEAKSKNLIIVFVLMIFFKYSVKGHGRLMEPPNRSSLWRFGLQGPANYNDMSLNCGGFGTQYFRNHGKCGICGDNYADRIPRKNENGGLYGKGLIAKNYQRGDEIFIWVDVTQEHKGYFEFGLCDLSYEPESEECFQPIPLIDGSLHYPVFGSSSHVNHTMRLQLPGELSCSHCVLRWHYKTGNSNGVCEDGSEAVGCGKQEVFRSCADISIH